MEIKTLSDLRALKYSKCSNKECKQTMIELKVKIVKCEKCGYTKISEERYLNLNCLK
jgi:hypothetical protein